MSVEARRAYEEQTRLHHEVAGEIAAARRAVTRNQRMLEDMDHRIAAAATPALAKGLKQERLRIEVQTQTLESEVAARTAEYNELPQAPLEFMPVSIEVGVTETRSEKRTLLALADIMNSNSDRIASAGASASSSFVARSFDANASTAAPDPAARLERTRAAYFDALVDVRTQADGGAGNAGADLAQRLTLATAEYNSARQALGLEPVK
jgi:hypothetical protein